MWVPVHNQPVIDGHRASFPEIAVFLPEVRRGPLDNRVFECYAFVEETAMEASV